MNYDEAKTEAFEKLVPKKGDHYIQYSRTILTILAIESSPSLNEWWVTWSYHKGDSGSVSLSEWWARLNSGTVEPFDDWELDDHGRPEYDDVR